MDDVFSWHDRGVGADRGVVVGVLGCVHDVINIQTKTIRVNVKQIFTIKFSQNLDCFLDYYLYKLYGYPYIRVNLYNLLPRR